jgi:hypothetical protein
MPLLTLPPVLPVLLVRPAPQAHVRRSVRVSVVPCIPPAPLLYQAAVRRWLDGRVWVRAPEVRLVQAVCSVVPLLVLRLLEPLHVPAPEQARLPGVPASAIRVLAASRKGR